MGQGDTSGRAVSYCLYSMEWVKGIHRGVLYLIVCVAWNGLRGYIGAAVSYCLYGMEWVKGIYRDVLYLIVCIEENGLCSRTNTLNAFWANVFYCLLLSYGKKCFV